MSLTCFIIMPFGAENEQSRKHFLGVYESILAPAAERCGYTPKRSDLGGGPGNITGEIIRDLLEADAVIADLTNGNANVLFELGIRHVFRKSGTVHVVDAARQIPFDIQQYRAIKYSTELADIPAVINEIARAIKQREEDIGRSDNPVHDTIPDLPNFIRDIGEAAQLQRVAELQEKLESIQAENDRLGARLSELDPAGVLESMPTNVTVDKLLDEADEIMKSTGQYVMLELMQRANDGGPEAFVVELRNVLKSPYLSENDFLGLARMCVTLGLAAHRQAVLEVAYNRYPHDDQIPLALIDAYDDSPNATVKERGRLMSEELLHVERGPDQLPRLSDSHSAASSADLALALLFNFYFSAGNWEWVLSICESAIEKRRASEIVLRNRARALARMGRTEDAEAAFLDCIEKFPSDPQTLQWFGDFLDDEQRFAEAYEYSEKGVMASYNDPATAYVNLGIQVLNRGYARTDSGAIEGPLGERRALQYAIPLFLEAISRSSSVSVRETVVNILVRRDAGADAQAIREGAEPPGKQERASLDYILEHSEDSSRAARSPQQDT
jgi:tetratricopeptide (TPR) repeat protein